MTNDEIKQLPSIVDSFLDVAIINEVRQHLNEKLDEVCKLAIKALEQEPCVDIETIYEAGYSDGKFDGYNSSLIEDGYVVSHYGKGLKVEPQESEKQT